MSVPTKQILIKGFKESCPATLECFSLVKYYFHNWIINHHHSRKKTILEQKADDHISAKLSSKYFSIMMNNFGIETMQKRQEAQSDSLYENSL